MAPNRQGRTLKLQQDVQERARLPAVDVEETRPLRVETPQLTDDPQLQEELGSGWRLRQDIPIPTFQVKMCSFIPGGAGSHRLSWKSPTHTVSGTICKVFNVLRCHGSLDCHHFIEINVAI